MTIRLLVVGAGYPWRDSFAGAFHRDQIQLMAKAGLDVTFAAPTPWVPPGMASRNPVWRQWKEFPSQQQDGDVTVLRPRYLAIPRENSWGVPDIAQYLALRSLRLPRPDVIQSFFAVPFGAAARRLARRWSVPHVVGMLGADVNVYPKKNKRNARLLKAVIHDAAYAFANGPSLAAEAKRLTGISVDTVSIGVSSARFDDLPTRRTARQKLGLPQDKTIALYVGSLIPTKGIGELGQALDQLHDTDIVCVAVGEGRLKPDLEQRPNAICLGARPAGDVTLAMAAADMLVHPSYYEGLPTVLVEAAFARLPIVTTTAPGCIDLAGEGRAIAVPVGDAAALAEALSNAAGDPASLHRNAKNMLAHVQEYYSLEKNTARLVEVYRTLVSAGPERVA